MKSAIGLTLIVAIILFNTLPTAVALIALCIVAGLSGLVVGAYWYENAIRVQSELVEKCFDNAGLAQDLAASNARLAEVLDQGVGIPFTIIDRFQRIGDTPQLQHIPDQRTAGDAS